MAGFSIADFFAQLSIKADTKEVKKIEDSLNRINKALKMIGANSVAQAQKMDTAFSGDALLKQKLLIQGAHDRLERMGSSLVGFKERLNSINTKSQFLKIKNEITDATQKAQKFKNELKLLHNTNSLFGKENVFKKPDAFTSTKDSKNEAITPFKGGEDFFEKTVRGRRLLFGLTQEQTKQLKEFAAEQAKMGKSVADANMVLREQAAIMRKSNKDLIATKQKTTELTRAQNRLKESTRQLATSMFGAFAIFEGVKSINRIGQDFESMRASMLAVSGSSESAGKDLAYVRSEAIRLGLDLKETTKAFIKLKAGAGGKASENDLRTIFEGLTESSTVLGLTSEETTRAIRSVVQMFGKGGIRAEELRQQLGEVLPIAMGALEKATGKTSAEITKMLELGQLGLDVLPAFGRELKAFAREGNALAKVLETVRVQEQRTTSKFKESSMLIFESGFGEGYLNLLKNVNKILKDLEPTLKVVGAGFKVLFTHVGNILSIFAAPIKVLGDLFNGLFKVGEATEELSESSMPKLMSMGLLMLTPWGRLLNMFTLIKATIEEIVALTSSGIVGQVERNLGRDIGFDFGIGNDPAKSTANTVNKQVEEKSLAAQYDSYFKNGQGVGGFLMTTLETFLKDVGQPIVTNNISSDPYGNIQVESIVSRNISNGQAQR